MIPTLKMITPLATPVAKARFACSECGRRFAYIQAYGGGGIKGAATYMKTRFDKHVGRFHGATPRPVPAVTFVNEALEMEGRQERVVRGKGYWYLAGGEAHTWQEAGLYSLGSSMPEFKHLLDAVCVKFEAIGVRIPR